MPLGFVLQATDRMREDGPVVLLHGRLDDGRSFLLRDSRQRPYFWIPAADRDRARSLRAPVLDGPTDRVSLTGQPVLRVDASSPEALRGWRERLETAGIECFEADLRLPSRYLIDRGLRGSLAISGRALADPHVDVVFEDPQVERADWTPRLRVLALDIETDPGARRLLSCALHGCGLEEVLLITPPGSHCPPDAVACANERELLRALLERVRSADPDVLTGWNVVGFDLAVLARVARRVDIPLALGRGPAPVRIRSSGGLRGAARALVDGRLVLDGIELLRGAFVRLESYSLEAVSRKILGRGKTMTGSDRGQQILRAFQDDRPKLVEYNLQDARLVSEILERLQLIELAVERSRLTGLPPDRVSASIAAFDSLYLAELGRRGVVAPSVGAASPTSAVATSGGHVLEPSPGLYRNVLVLDYRSLYPSVIRTFQIDPLGLLRGVRIDASSSANPSDDPIIAPNGAAFRREPGILPALLDELVPRRSAARAAGDAVADQAIKILMNSFYGVLGTPACRFADPALANAITGFGKDLLLWSRNYLLERGYSVLYGDTDSLFVLSGCEREREALALGARLATQLNRDLARHVQATWRVTSRLHIEFERLYLRLFLPPLRHRTSGARKRYAGLVREGDTTQVRFTGLEVVRRDWTPLAREVQREIYERLFHDRPVADWLRQVVVDLRQGRLDDRLIYRKTLRKPIAEYTASTPPHVAAARKLRGPSTSRTVRYVMTTNGAEPATEQDAPLDHEHYVQKQLRPVVEPVLTLLGLRFADVAGDPRQGRLF